MSGFRVFLSAVSSEFAKARTAIATDLHARASEVTWQDAFRQEKDADTLLTLLHNYVRDCQAVICILGQRSGGCPPPGSVPEKYQQMLPDGITEASYTQWEFFFARHYQRRLSLYRALPDYQPDQAAPAGADHPDLQKAFLDHIKATNLHWSGFTTIDQLCRSVLLEDWPPPRGRDKPITLPYQSLGSLFKGREQFLTGLRASLVRDDGKVTAITTHALHGMGGIGKTRAAVEYAWKHQADYTALLFANAESGDALEASLAALTGPLLLAQHTATSQTAKLNAVLSWLRRNPGWLLILDNVDTQAALAASRALLGQLLGGHVLLTSRLSDFSGQQVDAVRLGVLPLDDAAAFLLERTDGHRPVAPDDPAQARALAEDLGQLALALEMAAATMRHRGDGFATYRRLWRDARDKVRGWASAQLADYPRAVAETWQASVAQLTPDGLALLERLAFLAPEPEPVPVTLLDVPVPGVPEIDMREALADLAAYSLVTWNKPTGNFTIHRLVQDVTRRRLAAGAAPSAGAATGGGLSADAGRSRLIEALGWIDTAFAGDPQDARNWPVLDPLANHADAVALHADSVGIADPTAVLMNRVAVWLQQKALFARAEPLMRRALVIDQASYGANHPRVAVRLNNLAWLLQATNQLEEAEPLMRRAFSIDQASYGPDHPDVAVDLNNLAQLLQATNRLGEAEPLMRRALAIDQASYGPDHPRVAIELNNLARLLHATNRLGEAEPLMRRAFSIDHASYGPDHPRVAIDLNNLAALLQGTNRLEEAEPLMRRALAIDEASYGPNHPVVARDLNNLARLLQGTNRLEEAEPLMRRALAIDQASYGPDHPFVARDLNNLALLLQDTNRLREAEPLTRRALAIDEASYGPDHPDVATHLNNLAALLQGTNRLGEAEPLMRRALAIDQASYGPDHPDVARDLNNLAMLLQAANRSGEAEPLLGRQLVIFLKFESATGHAHPHRDTAVGNYAGLLTAMGRTEAEVDAAIVAAAREAGLLPPETS